MIHLTRLNGNPLVVNCELIKFAESSPDTVLTLTNGEKIVVRESCGEVVERACAWRARVFGDAARYLNGVTPLTAPDGAQRVPSPAESGE